jgi:hypothetical protein
MCIISSQFFYCSCILLRILQMMINYLPLCHFERGCMPLWRQKFSRLIETLSREISRLYAAGIITGWRFRDSSSLSP